MAKKQKWKKRSWEEKKGRVNKITDEMNQSIDSYFETPEQMKEYLSFMSKFYQYSPRNSALIHGQFRGAQAVGSFKFWQEKGFSVQKGEKGIKVLVPNKIPPKFKDENGKWKNIKYATDKQKKQIEKGELQRKVSRLYFSLGHVFDVSQTNAKASDIPEIFPNRWMEGNVENYDVIMKSLNKIGKDLEVTIGAPLDELGSAKGAFYYALDKEGTIGHIGLNPRNSELQNVKTMIHELAHAKLHSGDKALQLTSEEEEFQAEMVAYATASYFGIDTNEYSLKYLADWTKGKELHDKAKLLSEVRETSVGFIHVIEQDLVKEREKTLEEIKESYLEFVASEYSSDADEENLQLLKNRVKEIDLNSIIPVAYTTVGDNDEFELQVSLNLEEKRLERVLSGEYVSEEESDAYDSYEEIMNDISEWNFDNLIENGFDYDELSQKENEKRHKLLKKKPKEFSMEM